MKNRVNAEVQEWGLGQSRVGAGSDHADGCVLSQTNNEQKWEQNNNNDTSYFAEGSSVQFCSVQYEYMYEHIFIW